MKVIKSVYLKKIGNRYVKALLLPALLLIFCSHDLYLKMESYFLATNQEATLSLYNGTFEKSENIITRDRMLDASVVSQGKRVPIQADQWKDQDSTITYLSFMTGTPGTYVAGVSTKARNIELTAQKFNDYLQHDGVLDMLEYRTKTNQLEQDAVESYQKHVKAIYQVGDTKTKDWSTILGYPIEFVPLENPYEKYSGDSVRVKLLLDGQPLAGQLIYANHIQKDHSHSRDDKKHTHDHDHKDGDHHHSDDTSTKETHTHAEGQQLRTDAQGIAMVPLPEDGIYYLRTIHMVNTPDHEELTHQSKWATLTFQVSHKHDSSTHTHTHQDQSHAGGIPTWMFIAGSVLLIGLLFLIFVSKGK